ncbi:ABC transporter ATP-binding protein [Streptomyces sp. NPDC058646]|uniref:ABC transporter ATP-binding protein n=1 Tax=Streptomyces sp. NPDC058646 TaxID=3346574 RepID=UPI0036698C3E
MAVGGTAILALVVASNLRERRNELGILLSLGERKPKLLAQHLVEVAACALVAVGLAAAGGQFLSQAVGDRLLAGEVSSAREQAASENRRPDPSAIAGGSGSPSTSGQDEPAPIDRMDIRVGPADIGRIGATGLAIAALLPGVRVLRLPPRHPLEGKLTMAAILELAGVSHTYRSGSGKRTVLKSIDYAFEAGRTYAVIGPSGSGKTTLLSLASGLDTPTAGTVRFDGRDVREIGLGTYRNQHAATVFQSLNLLTYMTAVQNITSAMEITRVKGRRHKQRAVELLDLLGIDRADQHRRTLQLSGGQQQRVAIARALACEVDVLFADEPTGALDHDTAADIIEVFRKLARDEGKCVIVVTHSPHVASASDEILRLKRGRLSLP